MPHFIDHNGKALKLHRVDLGEKVIGESFLQQHLHENPAILPATKLDESFALVEM